MTRFLIEIPHEASKTSCMRELDAYLQAGAHYLTNAEWGCLANDHRAWLTVDVSNEIEARMLVPPVARHKAAVRRYDLNANPSTQTIASFKKSLGPGQEAGAGILPTL
ncbi:MAG: hypothetical protein EXR67_06420 [Dehalococcoidia bacterium]|nr:hypothetical protein [Dehalococcoidia bacterium]